MKRIFITLIIIAIIVTLHEIPSNVTSVLEENELIIHDINSINIDSTNIANGHIESLEIKDSEDINAIYDYLSKIKVKKVYKILHGNYKKCAKKQYYTGHLNFTVKQDIYSNMYLIIYRNKTEKVYAILDDYKLDAIKKIIEY